MFERYTEKARRVIFFARYEASRFGSPYIETEHMLLGLLREDKGLLRQLILNLSAESVRQQIESATLIREKIQTLVDLPLSNESGEDLGGGNLRPGQGGSADRLRGLVAAGRTVAVIPAAQQVVAGQRRVRRAAREHDQAATTMTPFPM
jgi:hypothetical protein